jgi:hypothetical protein
LLLVDTDPLPDGVRRLAMPLKLELPDAEELESIVKKTYLNAKRESLYEITAKLTNSEFKQIVHTLRGLTESEARRVVSQAIFHDHSLTSADLPRIVEAKRNLMQSSGCLEAVTENNTDGDVGG